MEKIAVLTSGGLDSCVLAADLASRAEVHPVYVEFGLAWDAQELAALRAFLAAVPGLGIRPLTVLQLPVRSIYGQHWSTTGEGVPAADTPDAAVYLPGRNVLLLGLTAVWCALNDVHQIAIGSLDENPFPDATPTFFADYGRLLSGAVAHPIEVIAPYRGRHKHEIIREHANLPLALSLTCMSPHTGAHCGACNKCFERQQAFLRAGVADGTRYAG